MYQVWEQNKGRNMSTTAEAANANKVAQKGRDPLKDTYQNKYPKGQNDRALRSDAIAVFAILTPLARGTKSRAKRARVGSFPFCYISIIYL